MIAWVVSIFRSFKLSFGFGLVLRELVIPALIIGVFFKVFVRSLNIRNASLSDDHRVLFSVICHVLIPQDVLLTFLIS